MQVPVTRISPQVNVRRTRLLDSAGRVNVRIDQKVNATDVISEQQGETRHTLVDIYLALGINSPNKSKQWTSRKSGDQVGKNEILAETGVGRKRVLRAQDDCRVVTAGGGQMMLETQGETLKLNAGLPGKIVEIIPERGAIIEENGALIQGAWGNGKISMGPLQVSLNEPGEEMTSEHLDTSMRGSILVFGYCSNPDVLKRAGEINIRGLILGSMSSELIPAAENVPFPVILTEGFGHFSINRAAYKILVTNDKRDAAMNASVWDRYSGERPEIFIPLLTDGDRTFEDKGLAVGQVVRIHGVPDPERMGEVAAIFSEPRTFPNGFQAQAAEIFTGSKNILVPQANLEIIG